jgi:uncharacterized protein YbjT (DUF2867 family)
MYAITGASGHIGRRIVERLVHARKKVRAIARERSHLAELERQGAEAWPGNLRDTDFLVRAFRGARAVFTMIPPSYGERDMRGYQNEVGRAIAEAVERVGVKHVVNLSSLGADLESGTGPILGLHDQEERLDRLEKVNVLHLRPTFFMENLLSSMPMIEQRRVLGMALRADLRFPLIATRDIAEVAGESLLGVGVLRRGWKGKVVRTLLGQRDLTMTEVAKVLGEAIGVPNLPYVQVSYEDANRAMIEMGCSSDVARGMVEMLRSMNEGKVLVGTPRSSLTTTPTSIEQFAVEFADAYAAATHRAKAA